MGSAQIQLRFNGLLVNGQTTGQQSESFDRVITRVQLSTQAAPPTANCQIQLRVGGVANAQVFLLAAGLSYAAIAATGNGISVPAGSLLDAIVVASGSASGLDLFLDSSSGAVAPSGNNPDCGLGVLSQVKAVVLAQPLQCDSAYDASLTMLAQAFAGLFDKFCNRRFARVVGEQEEFNGDRRHFYVTRYPLESVSLIELRASLDDGYETLADAVFNIDTKSGLVFLAAYQGWSWTQIRCTYTGGYWYDATPDQSGALPAGATQLPSDVVGAWLLQISEAWDKLDRLGVNLTEKPGIRSHLSSLTLLPQVKELLAGYIRYAMT